jgi:hypothetical protein
LNRRPRTLRALLGVTTLALTAAGAGALAAPKPAPAPATGSAAKTPFALVQDRDVNNRLAQPEDRYAVAGGCYTLEAPGQGFVTEADGALGVSKDAKAAAPFHFQPTRLGEYLIATNRGRDTRYEGADWDVRGYLAAGSTAGLLPSSAVAVADAPSEDAEWRLVASGSKPDAKARKSQTYVLSVPARDEALSVRDGDLSLAAAGTPLRLRHVRDDNPKDGDRNGTACASWPEIDPGATGEPKATARRRAAASRASSSRTCTAWRTSSSAASCAAAGRGTSTASSSRSAAATTRRTRRTACSRSRWAATPPSTPRPTTRRAGRPSRAGRATARSPTSSSTGAGSSGARRRPAA